MVGMGGRAVISVVLDSGVAVDSLATERDFSFFVGFGEVSRSDVSRTERQSGSSGNLRLKLTAGRHTEGLLTLGRELSYWGVGASRVAGRGGRCMALDVGERFEIIG